MGSAVHAKLRHKEIQPEDVRCTRESQTLKMGVNNMSSDPSLPVAAGKVVDCCWSTAG